MSKREITKARSSGKAEKAEKKQKVASSSLHYRRNSRGRLERFPVFPDLYQVFESPDIWACVIPFIGSNEILVLLLCLFFNVKGFNLLSIFEPWFLSAQAHGQLPIRWCLKPKGAAKMILRYMGNYILPLYRLHPGNIVDNVQKKCFLPCVECVGREPDFHRGTDRCSAHHMCYPCVYRYYPNTITSLISLWRNFPAPFDFNFFRVRARSAYLLSQHRDLPILTLHHCLEYIVTSEDALIIYDAMKTTYHDEVAAYTAEETASNRFMRLAYLTQLQSLDKYCKAMQNIWHYRYVHNEKDALTHRESILHASPAPPQ